LCDRYTVNLAKSQLGFIDFVVAPLFGLIKEVLPKVDLSNLETNKNKWKDLVDHYEEELSKINIVFFLILMLFLEVLNEKKKLEAPKAQL
jgi:hypothetical protein